MHHETGIRADHHCVVQARGALLAIRKSSERVVLASENAHIFAGSTSSDELLDRPVMEWLGREITHALRNAESFPSLDVRRLYLGRYHLAAGFCALSVYSSGDLLVLEIFPTRGERQPSAHDVLKDVNVLTDVLAGEEDQRLAFERLAALLRTISGFHCVALDALRGDTFETVAVTGRKALDCSHVMAPPQLHCVEDINASAVSLSGVSGQPMPDLRCAALMVPPDATLEALRSVGVSACSSVGLFDGRRLCGRLKLLHETPRLPNQRTHLALAHLGPLMGQRFSRLFEFAG